MRHEQAAYPALIARQRDDQIAHFATGRAFLVDLIDLNCRCGNSGMQEFVGNQPGDGPFFATLTANGHEPHDALDGLLLVDFGQAGGIG